MTRASDILDHAASLPDPGPLPAGSGLARYPSYRELIGEFAGWVERGARPRRIGASVEGEPLWAFEIGPSDAPRWSLLMAGIHAMEWIGVAVGRALVEGLRADPPTDRAVLVVPLVNPDGFRRVEADLRAGRRRFQRVNANGVDLNRNFPTFWRKQDRRGRALPFLGTAGVAPASEPEIAGLLGALETVAETAELDVALSLHSIGRRILYSYGGRWAVPADVTRLRAAAESIDALLAEPYTISQSSRWVPGAFANGMEIDHLHDRFGALALLVECSWGGASVGRPGSWLSPPRWFNPPDPDPVVGDLAPALDLFLRGRL